jgi:hypothetical protein
MNLLLTDPELMPELLTFLRRVHCVATQTGADTVEVSLPEALDDEQARMEIDLYLWAWRLIHPGADVQIGSRSELLPPLDANTASAP